MQDEVAAASKLLTRIIGSSRQLTDNDRGDVEKCLRSALEEHFGQHWYSENPARGQGFRCIRVNGITLAHPVLQKAADVLGCTYAELKLPSEMSLWVDPKNIVCKVGEQKCHETKILWHKESGETESRAESIDIKDLLSSSEDSKRPFVSHPMKQSPPPSPLPDEFHYGSPPGGGGLHGSAPLGLQVPSFSVPPPPPHSMQNGHGMHPPHPGSANGSPNGRFVGRGHQRGNGRHNSGGGPNGWHKGGGKFHPHPPHGGGKGGYHHPHHPPTPHPREAPPPWSRGGGDPVKA